MEWNSVYYFVMVPMAYAAFVILIGGIIFKLIMVLFSKKFRGKLGAYPMVLPGPVGVIKDALLVPVALKKDKVLWFFIIAYHAAFLFLFIGHLELIKEFKPLQIIPHQVFLGAGAVGVVLIISVLFFLFRRFKSPWREISVPEDYVILLLLFMTMVIGSHLHLAARYGVAGFDIPVDDYRAYLSSLVALNPAIPDGMAGSPHYVLVVLHVFLANLVLMLMPFSKMIHMVYAFLSLNLIRK